MKTRLGHLRLLMALAVGLAITCQSFALDYVFTRIVDNTDSAPYGTFELFGTTLDAGLAPAISNGVVLYGASYSTHARVRYDGRNLHEFRVRSKRLSKTAIRCLAVRG